MEVYENGVLSPEATAEVVESLQSGYGQFAELSEFILEHYPEEINGRCLSEIVIGLLNEKKFDMEEILFYES